MHFSEARHSEGNIRALRKSQPLIKGDPNCWKDIRRLTPNFGVSYFHPNFGVCYFHFCKQILSKASSSKAPVQPITIQGSQAKHFDWLNIRKAGAFEKL